MFGRVEKNKRKGPEKISKWDELEGHITLLPGEMRREGQSRRNSKTGLHWRKSPRDKSHGSYG